ncbi:hypothetical protein PTTG_28988 [Puccinia triticina 1-1 BBBD Race 1]|uniref:C2H2-type domain-containing protein n=1 Tax=Puccinia triticina (isolate 1-1 / race 1 (BBBD)) TaxID=630390 RepID=A0A180G792_PUCT1|nr:hypothetical protein PTTG_28988 [Puccinia triticina 1-1 BBBD Race 1]
MNTPHLNPYGDGPVGRKRHGNLSLNCSREACDHKAAKRDYMTSHMLCTH